MFPDVGQRIKQCRKEQNMTQREFAKLLHISVNTLSNYEHNRTIPPLSFVSSLADILNTTMDDIIRYIK